MTGAVTRKIAILRQLEEMRLLANEQQTELVQRGRRSGIPSGLIQERLERQQAIVQTLEFCAENEGAFREWAKTRKAAT